ncbi:MAG: 50S ribosomal protein L17 [Rickettsiaceae bacterium]
MRHKIKGKKLNRTSSHRKAMFANMATSLIMNEQIQTTVPKAKALRPIVERLVTKARKGTLAAHRDIIARIKDKVAANKLMSILAARYKERPGGYTRVVKAGFRYGDRAPIAYIEFVNRDVKAKGCMTPKSDTTEQEIQE